MGGGWAWGAKITLTLTGPACSAGSTTDCTILHTELTAQVFPFRPARAKALILPTKKTAPHCIQTYHHSASSLSVNL